MKNNKKQKIIRIVAVTLSFALFANTGLARASEITVSKMVELTNESRVEAGLGSLTTNNKLEQAAKAKAADMLAYQYFEHTSPQGVTPWYWFNQAGYEYVFAAENLAIDFVTAEGAHSALMKSTGHRENILGANYKEIGIAVTSGKFEGKDSIIIVEDFGSQREQRITINNAPFFETISQDKNEVKVVERVKVPEKVKPRPKPESVPVMIPVEKIETQAEAEDIPAPVEIDKIDSDVVVSKQSTEAEYETPGKVIPKVYAVRNVQGLKKVYVEDIYWEEADGDGLIESLGDNTTKIKILIRSLTGSILYALL